MSKMQEILDAAEKKWAAGQANEAFKHLVEAIKLLSKVQQQIMTDFERAQASRTDRKTG